MKSFWEESYDSAKDRRYGLLFFATLLVFLVTVIVGGAIYVIAGAMVFQQFVLPALTGVGIVAVIVSWQLFRRARKRRAEQLKFANLSRDELAKARSKLRNNIKPVRPVVLPAPDTDLKY